jgi:hypothetical protein
VVNQRERHLDLHCVMVLDVHSQILHWYLPYTVIRLYRYSNSRSGSGLRLRHSRYASLSSGSRSVCPLRGTSPPGTAYPKGSHLGSSLPQTAVDINWMFWICKAEDIYL